MSRTAGFVLGMGAALPKEGRAALITHVSDTSVRAFGLYDGHGQSREKPLSRRVNTHVRLAVTYILPQITRPDPASARHLDGPWR